MYSSSVGQPHHQSARYYDYPARREADLSRDPRFEVYEKESSVSRRPPDSDRDPRDTRIVRSRPIRTRESSPDEDYERTAQRKSLVIRPRSTSRVRLREPASVVVDSSSDDEPRRRRKDRADDTHIRATSRPGKRNEYAFVRTPSKGRRKSDVRAPAVHDLELKTDRRHKHFQHRRNDMENTEAAVLVRARSRERDRSVDDDSDSDDGRSRRRRSKYRGEIQRKRRSLDDSRREVIIARDDRDHDDRRRRTRDSKLYTYGTGLVVADEESLHSNTRHPRRRHVSLSPDRNTVTSSRAGDGVERANTVTSRDQKPRRSRAYDDWSIDPEKRRDPRKDSAYHPDGERRVKDREREAIDREKRAIDREKAALDREKFLVYREKRVSPRDVPDDRRRSAGDYLKQGDQYIKDGQKYHKTGQGLVGSMKNLFA